MNMKKEPVTFTALRLQDFAVCAPGFIGFAAMVLTLSACAGQPPSADLAPPPPAFVPGQKDISFNTSDSFDASAIEPAAGSDGQRILKAAPARDTGCAGLRSDFAKGEPVAYQWDGARLGLAFGTASSDEPAVRATLRYALSLQEN